DPQDVGVMSVLLINSAGCDSLVITETTLLASDTTELLATSCDPQDVGVMSVLLMNSAGCDSLVITETTLLASDTTELMATSCDPQDVGVMSVLLINSAGCDSLVITETTLLASDTTELLATSCDPQDVGTASILLMNSEGCDSLVITETTLLASDTTELFATSCDPQDVGIRSILLMNANGCDSLIITETFLLPSDTTELTATSCDPTAVGVTSITLSNTNGCDSLIITTTVLSPPDSCGINALLTGDTLGCNESSGQLSLLVDLGQAPFDYQWEGDGLNPLGQGSLNSLNTLETISGLMAGNYTVTITSASGFSQILSTQIIAEPPLAIGVQIDSDFNGTPISCAGAADGSAFAEALSGGTAPYSYDWSNGQDGAMATELGSGWHFVSVTDAEGCRAIDSVFLVEPAPLELQPLISDPSCFDAADGWLAISQVDGGIAPYSYALNDGPLQPDSIFFGLGAGTYRIRIADANGCEGEELLAINAPLPVDVGLGRDTSIQLGDSVRLQAVFNLPDELIDSIFWSNIDCIGCDKVTVSPVVTTSYSIRVTDVNGCPGDDEVIVEVRKDRNVYIPNAFSPNGDNRNDEFQIYAGLGVKRINTFQIYNRWGEKLHEANNFLPNAPDHGWDGVFKGEVLNPAVFVYWAEIEFDDGEVILYKGDVTLVK
ncbi:MAG: gliding motility-associated C-terminal domain-containing protein, partial [Bacteroidota bacterium]